MAASLVVAGSDAQAQSLDLSKDQVTVDLSVIEGSRSTPAPATPYVPRSSGPAPRQGLLLPGRKNPVSQLHVAAPKGGARIKLKKPGTRTKKPAKRVAKKAPPVKKAVVKKPKPPVVAAVKPPAIKAVEKPVAKKAPAPAKPAAPPPTVTAAMPKPKEAKKEQAAVSPAPKSTPTGRALQVVFADTASKLPAKAKKGLKDLALKLKSKDTLRLQLMAYAGGKALTSSKARRMSLSRALSIRSFLIENGVRSTRIDVRALGSKTTEKPLNRVDVNIVER